MLGSSDGSSAYGSVPFIPLLTQHGDAVRLLGVCWLVFFEQLRQLKVLELEAL